MGMPSLSRVRLAVVLALAMLLATACSRDAGGAETTVIAGGSPEEVVTALMEAIDEGRFEDTPDLTDTTQAGLLALAEGADASEVLDAIDEGGEAVAANFWSGFAQTIEGDFEPDEWEATIADPVTESGQQFVTVTLESADGRSQTFVVRRDGDWKVDLMATFGPVLAERLVPPVDVLLSSANAAAGSVLAHLNEATSSLSYATTRPDLPAEAHQALLALIERVTRAG